MSRAVALRALLVASFLGLCAAGVDAAIVTDEERLEEFVDSFEGKIDDARLDGALAYMDPVRQPIEISLAGETLRFDDGDQQELAAIAREGLGPLFGSDVRLVQDAIELEGDWARVAIRASTREGMVNAQFRLQRHEEGWLVSRVSVN